MRAARRIGICLAVICWMAAPLNPLYPIIFLALCRAERLDLRKFQKEAAK